MSNTISQPSPYSGLPRALHHANLLNTQQIDTISRSSITEKIPFIDALLKSRLMDATSLAEFCSQTYSCPLLDLSTLNPQYLPEKIIDVKLMQSQRVIILSKRDNKLAVAIADPTQTQALDQVKFQTGLPVEPVVVALPQLLEWLNKLGQSAEQNLTELIGDDLDSIDFITETESQSDTADSSSEIDDAPVVRFLQKILTDAINMGASDLHFEPFEKFYRIRFRIDGVLREIAQPPLAIKEKLASRIKVISRLDIAEKRVPQDGRGAHAYAPGHDARGARGGV
jgi:type IV pilus assembly protein PilB